jgi:hypothetical protein
MEERSTESTHDADAARQQPSSAGPARATSRRGFLGFMGRLGVGVIGGMAGVATLEKPADAHGYHYSCCHLARSPGGCPGSGSSFTCPTGYNKRVWYCCRGVYLTGCGECTKSTSCWSGPYACSEYWLTYFGC